MQFKASDPAREYEAAIGAIERSIAHAATAGMHAIADRALSAARASIAAGGFGPRWQNAMRARVFPASGEAIDPAAEIFSKIPYAPIFEDGGTIQGRPVLWLPIEANLPASGRKWRPRLYIQLFGPLVLVSHPGRPPLLYDARRKKFVFVGMDSVSIRKRFDVAGAVRDAVAAFDAEYQANFKVVS